MHLPRLHEVRTSSRVALEAYPGLLARELIGSTSYKSDDKAKQTPERLIARKQLLQVLELGQTRLGLRLKLTHAQHDSLVADASGDRLDAVLCMVQAAWAQGQYLQGDRFYGLPPCDPLEGWIVSALAPKKVRLNPKLLGDVWVWFYLSQYLLIWVFKKLLILIRN